MVIYEVVVGNLGSIVYTADEVFANAQYTHYVELSKKHYGRVADEPVTLMKSTDGHESIILEYSPEESTDETP